MDPKPIRNNSGGIHLLTGENFYAVPTRTGAITILSFNKKGKSECKNEICRKDVEFNE
ncbi:hypothetical protein GN156_12230 [bacterium LRH843]|nr:hypothetical protein [bacterium LRH843]